MSWLKRMESTWNRTERENINGNWSAIERFIGTLRTQLNNIVASAGKDNSENVAARTNTTINKSYTSVGDRLDKEYAAVQAKFTTKADQSFVDAQFASIVSGSPKGTFTDYAALVAKYPNGAEGTMLVLADGHWYWWDSVTKKWEDGGLYQAQGIADKSITPQKTTFIKTSKNLFDKNKADKNGYHNSSNVYATSSVLGESDFIEVVEGENYTSSLKGVIVNWYKADKSFLTFTPRPEYDSKGYVTAPAGAAYVKFIYNIADIETTQVEQAISLGAYESYVEPKLNAEFLPDLSIRPEETTFFDIGSRNLFNKNAKDALIGKYFNAENQMIINDTINQTGLIKVEQNEDYTTSQFTLYSSIVLFYDINKNYIDFYRNDRSKSYVTIPWGVHYARFISTADEWDTFQVEKGRSSSVYVPYAKTAIKNEFLPDLDATSEKFDAWSGMHFVSLGDSITARNDWQPFVVEKLNFLHHTNLGIGGTTLGGNGFNEAFHKDVRLNAVKAANPDVLTILGGANDLARNLLIGEATQFELTLADKDRNTFIGAYSYIIETLLTWKPTLRIFILGTTWGHDDGKALWVENGGSVTTKLTYTDFRDACKLVAQYYGLPYIDVGGEMGLNKVTKTLYLSDGIHPNAYGAARMAEVVIGKMKEIEPIEMKE